MKQSGVLSCPLSPIQSFIMLENPEKNIYFYMTILSCIIPWSTCTSNRNSINSTSTCQSHTHLRWHTGRHPSAMQSAAPAPASPPQPNPLTHIPQRTPYKAPLSPHARSSGQFGAPFYLPYPVSPSVQLSPVPVPRVIYQSSLVPGDQVPLSAVLHFTFCIVISPY